MLTTLTRCYPVAEQIATAVAIITANSTQEEDREELEEWRQLQMVMVGLSTVSAEQQMTRGESDTTLT